MIHCLTSFFCFKPSFGVSRVLLPRYSQSQDFCLHVDAEAHAQHNQEGRTAQLFFSQRLGSKSEGNDFCSRQVRDHFFSWKDGEGTKRKYVLKMEI